MPEMLKSRGGPPRRRPERERGDPGTKKVRVTTVSRCEERSLALSWTAKSSVCAGSRISRV
jgi:hypothetical protein